MRILVIGASGRTGRQIVEQALGHGHEVRALVRSQALELSHPRLEVVTGDVLDFDAVSAAVEGMDAVAFAAGSSNVRPVTVYSAGMANVVHAMALHQVDRVAMVTAAGVGATNDPNLSVSLKVMITTVLRPVYQDMEAGERRLMASGLDWTIVRPVGLSDGPLTGTYRVSLDGSLLPKSSRVSRADVAALVLKALETGSYSLRTLVIADG